MSKIFIFYVESTKYVVAKSGKCYGVFATEYDSWGYEKETTCVKTGSYEECIAYVNDVYVNYLF